MRLSNRLLAIAVVFSFTIQQSNAMEDAQAILGAQLAAERTRMAQAQAHLVQILQTPVPDGFRIDACCSGGGYRAMVATTGFTAGLQEIGLYDGLSAMACLSGSTWMMGHYMARNVPMQFFIKTLRARLMNVHFFNNIMGITEQLTQILGPNNLQFFNVYGALVANHIMGDLEYAQAIPITMLAKASNYPFPIFTAIHRHFDIDTTSCWCRCCTTKEDRWFEINPFTFNQIRAKPSQPYIQWVPTNDFGNHAPLPLASILGICGSAYSLDFGYVFNYVKGDLAPAQNRSRDIDRTSIMPLIRMLGQETIESIVQGSFLPACLPNFTGCGDAELTLADAGIAFNLPFPPLNERQSNVIFVCDADGSDGTKAGHYPELKKAAEYAKQHGWPFPDMSNPISGNGPMLIFRGEGHEPTIIYFYNTIEKSTMEFNYTRDEFDSICGSMHNAVVANAAMIKAEILAKMG